MGAMGVCAGVWVCVGETMEETCHFKLKEKKTKQTILSWKHLTKQGNGANTLHQRGKQKARCYIPKFYKNT